MMNRVTCISQARMTSSRLPGKILKEVCGRTLLDYHASRLLKSKLIDRLVIATTVNSTDDPVEDFCRKKQIACVRGSENDVLSRYAEALKEYPASIVVRVTSDCPLIDPMLVDQVINYFIKHRHQYDYVNNAGGNFPRGLDVEVFSFEAFDTANLKGQESFHREHVTPYIYRENSEFRCGTFPSEEVAGHHRWCVDEPADFELVAHILKSFGGRDDFTWKDCLALFEKNPEWLEINRQVQQKTLTE